MEFSAFWFSHDGHLNHEKFKNVLKLHKTLKEHDNVVLNI